jgi:hypothetical protein
MGTELIKGATLHDADPNGPRKLRRTHDEAPQYSDDPSPGGHIAYYHDRRSNLLHPGLATCP